MKNLIIGLIVILCSQPMFGQKKYKDIVPDTAKVLAKSKGCPRQIIKYSEKHYGFQCHPEFTKKVAELLIDSDKDLEKKSQTLPFVQSPQTIRNNEVFVSSFITYL